MDQPRVYSNDLTVKEALEKYFVITGFGPNIYRENWVRIKFPWFSIYFPNTAGRKKAARFHDIHHILTEYPTTIRGEAEIGAFEIASGCGPHTIAWILDGFSMIYGFLIWPKRTWLAFQRGRRAQNLYHETYDEILLARTLGELRQTLSI